MNRRRLSASLGAVVMLAIVGLVVNLALGNAPTLGLDNGGGVKIVIAPTDDATVSAGNLAATRDAVRRELIAHRVVDGSARIEGDNVVVDVPNVADQAAVVAGVVAPNRIQLRGYLGSACRVAIDDVTSTVVDSSAVDASAVDASAPGSTADAATSTADSTAVEGTLVDTTATAGPSGLRRAPDAADTGVADTSLVDTTTVDSSAPTTTEPWLGPVGPGVASDTTLPDNQFAPPPPGEDDGDVVRSMTTGEICDLGPASRLATGFAGGAFDGQAAGGVFVAGTAEVTSIVVQEGVEYWFVTAQLSEAGSTAYNSSGTASAVAVLVDDVIVATASAPSGFVPQLLEVRAIDEDAANQLAASINRGAFGMPSQVSTVAGLDAAIGDGSWAATLIAGAVAVIVIAAAMVALYRNLGLIWLGAAALWALLCWSGAALLSQWTGFAIGLGAALLLVGFFAVLVAGSVLYFERLREDVRHGRRLRNSAQRSFATAWTRLLVFDVAMFVAGVLLMALSAESLRSFGAYLALAAAVHAVVTFGFIRPAVLLGAAKGWLEPTKLFPPAAGATKG